MSNEQPDVLKISAVEEINTTEAPPGTPVPTPDQIDEKLPPEEVDKRQKIVLEYTRLLARYCPPHNMKSRWVNTVDIPRVVADGKDLVAMCSIPRGKYSGISALAHSQIDDKDPLRFFVLPNGMVVINPVITDHTKFPIFKTEGCMSFPDEDIKNMIPRYNKVTATYQTLSRIDEKSDPVLSKPISENLNGGIAHIFQHEVSHLNGSNIYDNNFNPESAIGFGDGLIINPNLWSDKVEEIKNKKE